MNVLLVTSDWKWTGPAEPMLRLGLALRERGCDVRLACPEAPEPAARSVAGEARAAGLAPVLSLPRGRGLRPLRDLPAARDLRRTLEAAAVEILHCWHTRDHLLAGAAAASRRRRGATTLVRSLRSGGTLPPHPGNRWLLGPGSDGVLCVSPGAAARNARLRGGRPVRGVLGAVDLDRFRPGEADPRVRAELGLAPDARVVGIVARVQPHRRFDLLLEAARRLFARDPRARLLVVGRGTRRAELAEAPARRLGIADRVVFAGYRLDDYAAVLRCMDLFTFLVPGSDGSCRAVLEAAACGIPAVTSRRDALPEIVLDGLTGRLVDEDPEALARAWAEILADDARRAALGKAAYERARERFSPDRQAEEVLDFYREVRGRRT